MRTVVTNSEVPHLWAHQSQSSARNSTGSLFFEGPTIYSYGQHFPIATHVTNKRKEKAILLTTRHYSVTTSGHVSNVAYSIPKSVQVFHVDLGDLNKWRGFDAKAAIRVYNERIDQHERKAAKARADYSRNYELGRAAEIRNEALTFAKFYGLRLKVRNIATDLDAVKAAVNADAARKAKATKDAKAKQEREYADAIQKWLKGEYANLPYGIDTMLRVKDGEVETSRGARFPVEHARRGLVLVEAVRAAGEPWKRNGHTCHLGHYQIDSIDANGTVHAGCHVVSYKAIERIREQLISA